MELQSEAELNPVLFGILEHAFKGKYDIPQTIDSSPHPESRTLRADRREKKADRISRPKALLEKAPGGPALRSDSFPQWLRQDDAGNGRRVFGPPSLRQWS